jgi:hypothetical protein
MAIYYYPKLDVKGSHSKFIDFVGVYNNERSLSEQIRPIHEKVFVKILKVASCELYNNNKKHKDFPEARKIDNTIGFPVETNNVKLSYVEKSIAISTKSVYRHIIRLKKAGIISKKAFHGSKKNYELVLNPAFLSFIELSCEKGPSSVAPGTKKIFPSGTNCPPKDQNTYTTNNNLKIPVSKTNRSCGDKNLNFLEKQVNQESKTEHEDSANIEEATDVRSMLKAIRQKEKKVPRAAAPQNQLHMYQSGTAKYFFFHAVEKLFGDRKDINIGQLEKAYRYVVENYFRSCPDYKSVDQVLKNHLWRIEKAVATIGRNNYDLKYIFPYSYFDLERKGKSPHTKRYYFSFVNTSFWPKRYEKLKAKDRKKKKKLSETQILDKILKHYFQFPNVSMYIKCEKFLREKYPQLLDHFASHIADPFRQKSILDAVLENKPTRQLYPKSNIPQV